MSGNTAASAQPKAKPRTDRRVLRTRDTLGDALVELIQIKPFDEITVQQVLDKAGVARSTFYAHYSDKDDLFISDVEDFFTALSTALTRNNAPSERLVPVAEFLHHLRDFRKFHAALHSAGKLEDVFGLGQSIFARSIETRLALAGVASPDLPALADALAGSLFALIARWVGTGMQADPAGVDALFHRLAWNGIAK